MSFLDRLEARYRRLIRRRMRRIHATVQGVDLGRLAEVRVVAERLWPVEPEPLEDLFGQLDLFATQEQERLMGVEVIRAGMEGLRAQWVRENVALIKSVDTRYFTEVEDLVAEAFAAGTPTRELRDAIAQRYGVSRSRASVIARDQLGKLNGEITRRRQMQAGVAEYVWRTSRDRRVRDSHAAREGQVYSWGGPGPHPGEEIQCRCTAEPVLRQPPRLPAR